MQLRRAAVLALSAVAALGIVAGCTSSSDGDGTPSAVATDTVTATATDTVSSAAPPTGSGVPASSTPPASGGSSGSGTASGPGLCTPTVMTFSVGRNGGAAGSTYFEIHATNASKTPCVTTGFPGIAFLDAAGQQILQAVRDDPDQVTTIVVQPGQQVSAQVRASSAGDGGQDCPSSPAFLFTLPDNTDSTKLIHTTPACSVSVAAFVKGAGI